MARHLTAYEKQTLKLFEDFDKAAKDWGWQEDQGTGARVDTSRQTYDTTKAALLKRIQELDAARRKAFRLHKALKDKD